MSRGYPPKSKGVALNRSLSVVVATRNDVTSIVRCVDSLLAQSFGSVQIIVVDYGSSDGTVDVVRVLEQAHPGIVTSIVGRVSTIGAALNAGIEAATGDFLSFALGKDHVSPVMYETLVSLMVSSDSDVAVCPVIVADHNGEPVEQRLRQVENFGYSAVQRPHLLASVVAPPFGAVFRARLIRDNGLRYRDDVEMLIQAPFMLLAALHAVRVVHSPEPMYLLYSAQEAPPLLSVNSDVLGRVLDDFDFVIDRAQALNVFRDEGAYAVERAVALALFDGMSVVSRALYFGDGRRNLVDIIAFMDSRFPRWRTRVSYGTGRFARIALLLRYRPVALAYSMMPQAALGIRRRAVPALRSWIRSSKQSLRLRALRRNIRRYGPDVFRNLDDALTPIGVDYFADFGTLLGFVREGSFLSHDYDIDLGVLAAPANRGAVRKAIEGAGYQLWRQWILDEKAVEESYRCVDQHGKLLIKFDINYYESDRDSMRTWLFYKDPHEDYPPGERSVVEMRYSRVSGISRVLLPRIGNISVPIPNEAERLLEEKYGTGWRSPDKRWVYWESPAAHRMPSRGYYIQY